MKGKIFTATTFCDDIRLELGNKHSLMGCYGSGIMLDAAPTVIPRLCAKVTIYIPRGTEFSNVALKVQFNNDLIAQMAATPENIESAKRECVSDYVLIMFLVTLSPLAVSDVGALRLYADVDSHMFDAGCLAVTTQQSN
jgi:hypothetical protein